MYPDSEVHSVEVIENGNPYSASYYVEHGVIVAQLDGKVMRVPVGLVDPHKTVRALLAGSVQRTARLSKNKDEWTSAAAEAAPRGRGRPKLVRGEPDA